MKFGVDILSLIDREPTPGVCGLCGGKLPWNDRMMYFGQWAHFLADSKAHRKYYGSWIIDSSHNGIKVCSLGCNNAVQIHRKSQPITADKVAVKIVELEVAS